MGPAVTISRRLGGKVGRFIAADPARRRLLVEAMFWLVVARMAVPVVPFRHVAPFLGEFLPPDDGVAAGQPQDSLADQVELAREIGRAVTRAARYAPFKAACLPQAIAAKRMLGHRGVKSALYFGGAKNGDGKFQAHAWVLAANVEVTGFPTAHHFRPISCFV